VGPQGAAEHGRSTEAESRGIVEKAARPEGRGKLAAMLAAMGRPAGKPRSLARWRLTPSRRRHAQHDSGETGRDGRSGF
jgi:plasmid stability protein